MVMPDDTPQRQQMNDDETKAAGTIKVSDRLRCDPVRYNYTRSCFKTSCARLQRRRSTAHKAVLPGGEQIE